MKWTVDQEKSIFAKPSNIVVSAAAGSGKTQVLTTRIIERIKNPTSPVSVEKLLIVTFTKAAAAEMKERIAASLRTAAKDAKSKEERDYLKGQLSLLGSAKICTIDSFCYDVVKQNFFKVNLPSDISIGENGELSLLRLAALEETVDALYCALEKSKGTKLSEENLALASLCEEYFGDDLPFILLGFDALTNACAYDKRDSEFTENIRGGGDYSTMIRELYQKAQSAAYPDMWLDQMADMYNADILPYDKTPFFEYAFSECISTIKNGVLSLKSAAQISENGGIGYEACLLEEAERLDALSSFNDYDALRTAFINTEIFGRLKGKKRGCDEELSGRIKTARDNVKKVVGDTLSALLEFSLSDCESLRTQLYPQIKALCSAAKLLGKIYYEKMTARRIIDFSACEHLALTVISENGQTLTDAGEAIRNKFDEIYIDETQDSNELQDMLFSLISKGRTFMVGDVKQSIYGFRNADPTIFMKKCDESLFDEDALKRKIFLSKNFRSSKGVISGVNSVFDIIMTSDVCSIDYKGEHRLDYGADFMPENFEGEKCEIVIVEKDGNAENQLINEMEYIVGQIKTLVASGKEIFDKDEGTVRPISYSDIAILMRSVSSAAQTCEAVFMKNGVPCYVDGGSGLFETSEVGQIIEILKLIDNAQSEIPLACALRSPMFMFDENDLLRIKLCSRESFCDAFYGICSGKYKTESALTKKCLDFMRRLSSWRKASGFISVEALIRRIYTDTNIYSHALSFPDGQMRRANLDLLLEKAEEFERSSYSGLFNFVNYVQKIKKTADNVNGAKAVSEKMDVVRIMSIHKSKGLEFPVVFVANCAKAYHAPTTGAGGLIINSRCAIGMNVINPLLRSKYKSPMQTSLLHMAKTGDSAEEMRLFYVALTRAREKLYAVCTLRDYDAFEKMSCSAVERLTKNEILNANSYSALLALAYGHGADKCWSITEISPREAQSTAEEYEKQPDEFCEDKEVSRMLDFKYPYEASLSLPNKASVSFLKSFDINLAPSEGGNISLLGAPSSKKIKLSEMRFSKTEDGGTFFGSAHHKMLQYLDYSSGDIETQRDALIKKGILSEEEAGVLHLEKLKAFIKSDLAIMMKNAPKLYREEPFVISVSAKELSPALPEDETLCVQGIIDCYFEKDEKTIVLVDYKTDTYDDPSEIEEKYQKQLYYYEMALKQKFKDKIIEKYLYLLHKNDIIYIEE